MRLSPTIKRNSHLLSDIAGRGVRLCLLLALLALPGGAQSAGQMPPTRAPELPGKGLPLAEVSGKAITAEEVESGMGVQMAQLEEQIYQLKRQRLEALINERLLAQAAAQRGLTVPALLDAEVTAKVGPVAEPEIEAFYQANKARLAVFDANMKERIRSYLQGQRLNTRREEFMQTLRTQAKVAVHLAPPSFRIKVPVEGAPFKGAANAPITIIEFSDFHCPFCGKVQATLAQVLARYGEKVKLVYRNFPIDQLHPQARQAAEAVLCANEQGKFWTYHDQLYANGTDVSPEKLKSLAQAAGLDAPAFETCLTSRKYQPAVQKEVEEATRLGFTGTPAFLINGRVLSGAHPLESFVRVIEEELAQTQAAGGKRLAPTQH